MPPDLPDDILRNRRAAFADGWQVRGIEVSRFDVRPDFPAKPPHAWFAHHRPHMKPRPGKGSSPSEP